MVNATFGNWFDVGVRALKSTKNNANMLASISAWEGGNALFKVENLEEESILWRCALSPYLSSTCLLHGTQ